MCVTIVSTGHLHCICISNQIYAFVFVFVFVYCRKCVSLWCQQNTRTAAVSVISLCLRFIFCLSLFMVANVYDYGWPYIFLSLFAVANVCHHSVSRTLVLRLHQESDMCLCLAVCFSLCLALCFPLCLRKGMCVAKVSAEHLHCGCISNQLVPLFLFSFLFVFVYRG